MVMHSFIKKIFKWIKNSKKEKNNEFYDFSEKYKKIYVEWKWYNFVDKNWKLISKK